MVRIAEIEAGSIADELSLEIGSRIVRINGERVRDGIDFTFLSAEQELELETVTLEGETVIYEIERDDEMPLGIVPAPDAVRECANKCVFCFIDGNPPGARDPLWLKDDDFRLSFAYGSYVTLTNLGPKGLQRLIEQRVSPLYVSVHATEPEVRERLLVNERAGLIMEQLRLLVDAGLELHTQVVLCPEWNDGVHLDRTIEDLRELGDGIRSLSIVPVGLTRYNLGRPVRLLRPEEAAQVIEQVDRARSRAERERGFGWCYAADELYLIAGRELPDAPYYDDGALAENGVGAVRRFLDSFESGVGRLPRLPGRRIRLATGASMAPFLDGVREELARRTGAEVEVVRVTNGYFGETVTVAGLLAGRDLLQALGSPREGEVILLPEEALNAQRVFIDGLSLSELTEALRPAVVRTGYDLTTPLEDL